MCKSWPIVGSHDAIMVDMHMQVHANQRISKHTHTHIHTDSESAATASSSDMFNGLSMFPDASTDDANNLFSDFLMNFNGRGDDFGLDLDMPVRNAYLGNGESSGSNSHMYNHAQQMQPPNPAPPQQAAAPQPEVIVIDDD
jgi:hypothetical protein